MTHMIEVPDNQSFEIKEPSDDVHQTPTIDGLIEEHKRLVAAAALLEQIWHEAGAYGNAFSDKTRYRLQDHFKHDDSE